MVDTVALVKFEGGIKASLEKGLDLIGGFKNLKSPLIIKPNICAGADKVNFAVTDVKLVEALIGLFYNVDSGLSIKIVESDSESKYADESFGVFGYKNLEKEMRSSGFDVSIVNLSRSPTVKVVLDGLYFKNPELPNLIVGEKYFVSIAVAKTHSLTSITGTLKNLFGLLPRKNQSFYHSRISDILIDLDRLVMPDLCIVDARVSLEGWAGPKTKSLQTFILGRNPVSVDATMARIMGYNPERISHLVEAEKFGLGVLNPRVVGYNIKFPERSIFYEGSD